MNGMETGYVSFHLHNFTELCVAALYQMPNILTAVSMVMKFVVSVSHMGVYYD